MTATPRENATETAEHDGYTAQGFFDEAILNEWLLSNPVPGTYSEFRKGYAALQRGKTDQYGRV